jgi:hypothetical protein
MEFAPFGQDVIPPTAGKATKYRMLYNSLEFGIEAFNLLFNLLNINEPKAVMVCLKILSGCKL